MALTYNTPAVKSARVAQANFIVQLTVDLDAAYPAGGYDLSGATGLAEAIKAALKNEYTVLHVDAAPKGAYYFGFDRTNNKLLVFQGTAGPNQEVPDTTDLSAVTDVELTVFCE